MGDIIKAGASVTSLVGLAGVCVAVLAAISIALIKKGVFPSITKAASAETVNRIITGSFWLAVLAAILGFSVLAMQNNTDTLRLFMVLVFLVFLNKPSTVA
jgi:TRAP-type mannitol/chloroaromatic compound transport system permease large subunit